MEMDRNLVQVHSHDIVLCVLESRHENGHEIFSFAAVRFRARHYMSPNSATCSNVVDLSSNLCLGTKAQTDKSSESLHNLLHGLSHVFHGRVNWLL